MNQLQRYEDARDRYEAVGVDTDAAIRKMMEIPVSLHCWQGDDFRTDAYRGKSAEILVKMLSMQPDKRQTIKPDDFRNLARDFKVTLPEKFFISEIKNNICSW